MIVKMKKVTVIALDKDADITLQSLRKLGVLHVEHTQQPKGSQINKLQEEVNLINSCLEILLQKELSLVVAEEGEKLADWESTAKCVISSKKRLEQLEEECGAVVSKMNQLEPWGDFQPEEIEALAQQNIIIRFYQVPAGELSGFPEGVIVKRISDNAGLCNCLAISEGKIEIPFKEVSLPKMSLEKLRLSLKEDKKIMQEIRDQLQKLSAYSEEFIVIKKSLMQELEFQQALKGMGQSDRLVYLSGFAPYDLIEPLRRLAKKEKLGLLVSEPTEEDNPPVLLRNPKWVSLINPVYKLMEVVPGYHELDISPIFLLFLSLFFGMIIGDAGYGAIYFALTLLAQRKMSGKTKEKKVFFLFYLFSSCAILWGLLTGTLFGQQWYLAKGFKALLPALNNAKTLMSFCFLLGALQLSLAHLLQVIKKLPSLAALADAGFICLLWAGFFLAKMFILGDPFPVLGQKLVWTGISLIILFTNPQKNLLKSISSGLGTLALGLVGNFGDVVSYIRLFAVGLAGVAVADSVNTLAQGAGGNIIAQILILFVGHSINIILGPMSVLVHGIRLNVLEFSVLHGNVTWGGLAYKPFKEVNILYEGE